MDWVRFWDYTQADWAGLQFFVLAVASIIALYQLNEARRLRKAQAAPYVILDFEIDPQQAIYLVISNIGTTTATDVSFEFAPPITTSLDARPNLTPLRDAKLLKGIRSLEPGRRIRAMFDVFVQRPAETYPDEYEVRLSYYGEATRERYNRTAFLDLGIYRGLLSADRQDVHDVHARLKDLVGEAKKWSAHGGGLLVLTPDMRRARETRSESALRAYHSPRRLTRLFNRLRLRLL